MADGFKIADGYVEISAEVDKNSVRQKATQAGQQSGDHFSRAMGQRVSRDLGRHFNPGVMSSSLVRGMGSGSQFQRLTERPSREAGQHAGRSWWAGMGQSLLTPHPQALAAMRTGIPGVMASPVGLAASGLGAAFAITFAASAAAALVSSAVTGVVGVGLLGLAAAGVRDQAEVQAGFQRMTGSLNAALSSSASGLTGLFVMGMDRVTDYAGETMEPRLTAIFTRIGPSIPPIFDSVIATVDAFLAGIEPTIGQLVPTLSNMAGQMPRLAEDAADFINVIVENGDDVSAAFTNLIDLIGITTNVLGPLTIAGTRTFNGFMAGMEASVPLLFRMTEGMDTMNARTTLATFLFSPLGAGASSVSDGLERLGRMTGWWGDRTGFANAAMMEITPRTAAFDGVISRAAGGMGHAITAAGGLAEALDILNGRLLDHRDAQRGVEEAIDAAEEAVRDNGATLDITTEKGRANQEALDAIAESAQVAADAVYRHTARTEGLAEAEQAAADVMSAAREEAVRIAIQMGMTGDEARDLADDLFNIPESRRVTILDNIASRMAAIDALKRRIESIRGRTVTVTTVMNTLFTQQFGANARQVTERYGGVLHARHGLVSSLGQTAGVMTPGSRPLVSWAEPGTGGEAFVARNAPRGKSLHTLTEAARWHRAVVVPMERAATTMAASAPAFSGGPTAPAGPAQVTVTVLLDGQMVEPRMVRVVAEHDRSLKQRVNAGSGRAR